ncbi:MAG: PEP-CTERM sorting domain-containing protein [Bryobacterales bacterium]|nr:PEP-CTERM sorting domain-containing protein [Bryobacterales bacterium]
MLREIKTVVALLLLASTAALASPIAGLYNTGPTGWTVWFGNCPLGANNCLPGDQYLGQAATVPTDAALVQPNAGTFAPVYPSWYTGPLRDSDDSVWITPSVRAADSPDGPEYADTVRYLPPDPGGPMDFGVGTFEFHLTFNLHGFAPESAWMEIVWLADGMLRPGCGIELNGNCVDTGTEAYQYFEPAGYRAYIDSGFLPEDNSLTFYVRNGYRETGLRATFDSFVDPIPEPSTYALLAAGLAVLAWKRRARR